MSLRIAFVTDNHFVPADATPTADVQTQRITESRSFYDRFAKQIGRFSPDLVVDGGDVGCGEPILNVLGNHDVDPVSASKEFFLLTLANRVEGYCSAVCGAWRLILLDTMDAADTNFTGSVGKRQLRWFRNELADSERLGHRVLLFSHRPLIPGPDNIGDGAWVKNYEQLIEQIVHACPGRSICGLKPMAKPTARSP